MAGVDERAGAKTLRGIGCKWKDVGNAFEYWAERIRTRLAELRAGESLGAASPAPVTPYGMQV